MAHRSLAEKSARCIISRSRNLIRRSTLKCLSLVLLSFVVICQSGYARPSGQDSEQNPSSSTKVVHLGDTSHLFRGGHLAVSRAKIGTGAPRERCR